MCACIRRIYRLRHHAISSSSVLLQFMKLSLLRVDEMRLEIATAKDSDAGIEWIEPRGGRSHPVQFFFRFFLFYDLWRKYSEKISHLRHQDMGNKNDFIKLFPFGLHGNWLEEMSTWMGCEWAMGRNEVEVQKIYAHPVTESVWLAMNCMERSKRVSIALGLAGHWTRCRLLHYTVRIEKVRTALINTSYVSWIWIWRLKCLNGNKTHTSRQCMANAWNSQVKAKDSWHSSTYTNNTHLFPAHACIRLADTTPQWKRIARMLIILYNTIE